MKNRWDQQFDDRLKPNHIDNYINCKWAKHTNEKAESVTLN